MLDGKLATMRTLQPRIYSAYPHIEALIKDLAQRPQLDAMQWQGVIYLRDQQDRFTPAHLEVAVTGLLVPGLSGV